MVLHSSSPYVGNSTSSVYDIVNIFSGKKGFCCSLVSDLQISVFVLLKENCISDILSFQCSLHNGKVAPL